MEPTAELIARTSNAAERPRPVAVSHAATHVGRREDNQDTVLADDDAHLYVVADGLGGRPGGATASRLAVDELSRVVRRPRDAQSGDTVQLRIDLGRSREENLLEHAVLSAHRAVMRGHAGELAEMATTVAALYLTGSAAVVAHVGDSRVYRLRGTSLEPLTKDHSLVNHMRRLGSAVSAQDLEEHAHVVTRALGVLRGAEPELRVLPTRSGDVFLLSSDGLHDTLPDTRLAELLMHPDPRHAADHLIQAAFAAGSEDNISAVVVCVR